MHHVAYWLDDPADVTRAAEVILEAGHTLEWGPTRHGVGEASCLYFREPGGMRIELNSGGYRNYQPDWEPVRWTQEQGANDFYRTQFEFESSKDMFPPVDAVSDDLDEAPAAARAPSG